MSVGIDREREIWKVKEKGKARHVCIVTMTESLNMEEFSEKM